MTLQEILERSAKRVGSKTFLFCDNRTISYENAVKQSRKAAGALASLGVKKGDRVAIPFDQLHRIRSRHARLLESGSHLRAHRPPPRRLVGFITSTTRNRRSSCSART